MLDMNYATIGQLQQAYREGSLTVKEVVLGHLARIAKIDSPEDGLKSVIEVNPDALFTAEALDRQWRETKKMPPLFGIPVLVKDNIGTSGKMRTSAASVALSDNYTYDAPIVSDIIEAGGVILGKANMTEFANYMTRDGMPNGYSSRGGQTLCPYNRGKDPSGSSSGSAVAVAAGLSTVSLGTETSGSIVAPAAANGVVGIKPTIGLVSRSNVIPISSTFDTPGPMARNVTDAAILLGLLTGQDYSDEATKTLRCPMDWEGEGRPDLMDYSKYLTGDNLQGIRIGLNLTKELESLKDDPDAIANFESLCQTLKSAGAVLIDNLDMDPKFGVRMTIMQHEFKACMNHYLRGRITRSKQMRCLEDIIQYNQSNAAIALKYGQTLLTDAQNKVSGNLTEPAYLEALAKREKSIIEMDCLFEANNLDVLLGDHFVYIAPYTGHPSMTIPTGQRKECKMPLHASLTARRQDEGKMLQVAYIMEKLLGVSIQPEVG